MAKRPHSKSSLLDNLPEKSRYVSRGGDKLRGALDALGLSVTGKICLDIGCSTGGFTDCLLQAGAQSIWAVDVGRGLLDYKLRKDPRVHVLERTNFRYLEPASLPEQPFFATVDVSFISLGKILPNLWKVLRQGGQALVLIKPQFEVMPKEAPRGVVKDEKVRAKVLRDMSQLAQRIGFEVAGQADSALKGPKGNQETFLFLVKLA